MLIAAANSLFGSQLMYSDDAGKAGEAEKEITSKILSFIEKYENEEFGIKQLSDDEYEIFSISGKYKGCINLNGKTILKIEEI